MKLNGGRSVTGVLRGFDPFMNVVVDETVEETKTGEKHNIGMVVSMDLCLLAYLYVKIDSFNLGHLLSTSF